MRDAASRPDAIEESLQPARPLSISAAGDLLPAGNRGLQVYRGAGFVERHATVRRGQTFARLLQRYDVSPTRAAAFERAARQVFDLGRIRPRRSISLFFNRETDELAALEYSIDRMNVLVVEGEGEDLSARVARIASSIEVRGVSGTIGESMTIDCSEAGVPERILSELTDIFAWDVDFDELQPGDSFRAVYEVAIGEDGEVLQTGAILAADVQKGGKVYTAVYHADEDGTGGYFDLDGHSLDRGQLRYPLEFTRISSEFSESRFHPILRRSRPHNGVDFAAPTGTPVRAVADGVVSIAGWQNDFGRAVRVEHDGPVGSASFYAHLSRIAANAVEGRHVTKGEVIGYVGQTGCATGPHLHFALFSGDEYLDPLRIAPPPRSSIVAPTGPKLDRSNVVLMSALESLTNRGRIRLTRLSLPGSEAPF